MKILYVGILSENDSALYRKWALERLGHTVIPLDLSAYQLTQPLLHKIAFRLVLGPHIQRFNRDLLALADREAAAGEPIDVLWADKVLELQPSTLRTLRRRGVLSASYMIDNAFGPRRDPGWRLYLRCLREFDLHITQRDVSVRDYQDRGARNVLKIQTAYEPTLHFPPPPGWSDADRERDVSFIGTPYDNRAVFLTRLAHEQGLPVIINGGPAWKPALEASGGAALYQDRGHGGLYRAVYRETIWRSRINLSFVTHSNQDEVAHKSFEIAACGGFLLAERSAGHSARFVEDEEAVFFSSLEECAEKIRRYLPDEAARDGIAAAGLERARASGYSNDQQVELIVTKLEDLLAQRAFATRA